MKLVSLFAAIVVGSSVSNAFVVNTVAVTPLQESQLSMGLFDFFSEDARKEREERKQREIDEQMRLQQEIQDRRRNPEKMEEYDAKVRVRRALRMSGEDDMAATIKQFDD